MTLIIFITCIVTSLLFISFSQASELGDALYLTPFINNGSSAEARKLSAVDFTDNLGLKSYSGFFTVNPDFNSNHFFWYFESESKPKTAPVILYLQGGPGASSLLSLFLENGPLEVVDDTVEVRPVHWALTHHLIFIDNPVGTGFSYTDEQDGYCTNETCVANDLYNSVTQFFQIFPELQRNEFYIGGESYACKYVLSLGMKIHEMNRVSTTKINFKGLSIGDGYCDPINQIDFGQYLYGVGLLDSKQKDIFDEEQEKVKSFIRLEQWNDAVTVLSNLIDAQSSYFSNFTGFTNTFNYLIPNFTIDETPYINFVSKPDIRKSIHVGKLPFNDGLQSAIALTEDLLKSVAPLLTELLSHYRVLTYNGQLDIVVGYPLFENVLKVLNFAGKQEYLNANRHVWMVEDQVAGYVKQTANLTEALVRNASHLVPLDQPVWAFDLITKFTHYHSFGSD